jgi:hypothetical protein
LTATFWIPAEWEDDRRRHAPGHILCFRMFACSETDRDPPRPGSGTSVNCCRRDENVHSTRSFHIRSPGTATRLQLSATAPPLDSSFPVESTCQQSILFHRRLNGHHGTRTYSLYGSLSNGFVAFGLKSTQILFSTLFRSGCLRGDAMSWRACAHGMELGVVDASPRAAEANGSKCSGVNFGATRPAWSGSRTLGRLWYGLACEWVRSTFTLLAAVVGETWQTVVTQALTQVWVFGRRLTTALVKIVITRT